MFVNKHGLRNFLKDGAKVFSGFDEALYRNIDACKGLGDITSSSFGPNGRSKLVVNHIEKLFYTSDTYTILKELNIQHPAAKLLVLGAEIQNEELGDGTNLLVSFGIELLIKAEFLITKVGLHINDVKAGYEYALELVESNFQTFIRKRVENHEPKDIAEKAINSVIYTKNSGHNKQLSKLITEAVSIVAASKKCKFDTDNIRVLKVEGGSLQDASVVKGMVMGRKPCGSVQKKGPCKVLILSMGLSLATTETSSLFLIKSAAEIETCSQDEEIQMEKFIKGCRDAGVEAIICGGAINDLAQHFCNKYDILTLKTSSKWEIKRLARTIGACPLARMGIPLPEELGSVESIAEEEFASSRVTVISKTNSKVATIVLRGCSNAMMDEMERAIEDGVNCIRNLSLNPGLVAGAGACEMELAKLCKEKAAELKGLERYAVEKFGEAFHVVPRLLAESSGMRHNDVVKQLIVEHQEGKINQGVFVEPSPSKTCDALEKGILDHAGTKLSAIRFATDAALNILNVDEIVVAKLAGGPKPPSGGHWDQDEGE